RRRVLDTHDERDRIDESVDRAGREPVPDRTGRHRLGRYVNVELTRRDGRRLDRAPVEGLVVRRARTGGDADRRSLESREREAERRSRGLRCEALDTAERAEV